MNRRRLLKAAGTGSLGVAGAALATPAVAQLMPEINWRLTSSFPKSLDVLYGAAETFAKVLAEMTDRRFRVSVFAAGEIVPALEATAAVTNGTVEMCHTSAVFSWDKDPALVFAAGIPFGLNQRQQLAWLHSGRGAELMNDCFAKQKLIGLPGGNTGAQMAGWFRKPINATSDLSGLRMRIGGPAAAALQKLGAVPLALPAGDIYSALDKGTIDAAEWFGPYDDEKLGFHKVARYYYYPSWWEGQSTLHFFVNQAKWAELPSTYQSQLRAAAQHAHITVSTSYDVLNIAALKRLAGAGAELKPFPEAVLDACFAASNEVLSEQAAKNADFKALYDALRAYRSDAFLWQQVAENTYDSYMMIQQSKRRL